MAYRNGTYVAFHANKTKQPTESDIKYLYLMRAWKVRSDGDFKYTDSHAKQAAVRDTSKRATLEASLKRRLRDSKNMVLVIGQTTKEDTDWVPFEIRYAVDECEIPIIAAYPGRGRSPRLGTCAICGPGRWRPGLTTVVPRSSISRSGRIRSPTRYPDSATSSIRRAEDWAPTTHKPTVPGESHDPPSLKEPTPERFVYPGSRWEDRGGAVFFLAYSHA